MQQNIQMQQGNANQHQNSSMQQHNQTANTTIQQPVNPLTLPNIRPVPKKKPAANRNSKSPPKSGPRAQPRPRAPTNINQQQSTPGHFSMINQQQGTKVQQPQQFQNQVTFFINV